jgi:hypothetical protein
LSGAWAMERLQTSSGHADECRSLANRSRSAEERDMLLNMAQNWDLLAVDRVAHIARQKRLAELARGSRSLAARFGV